MNRRALPDYRYLKLTKNVDEDPAVKHGLAVYRSDEVSDFLVRGKRHIRFAQKASYSKLNF